ncbi:hypothetical protein DM01DRAFT_1368500 [Hesseltinella vesiculosa]|uniref:Integral membrane protein n=1 Tax=Hesseltinella vesiculosa TaxID=101127 RepID=A0A1X2G7U5_9FUNG|nr:hypothetical protein DM01DRAFT_1368500 [Hesseltinella vesiculosa]
MPSPTERNASATARSTLLILAIGMLISGVCNTILNKYQDMQCVGNCDDPDPSNRKYFEQPVWQTLNMFVGEMLVWFVYIYQKWQAARSSYQVVPDSNKDEELPPITGIKCLLFWVPTLCDLTGTTLMNVGLLFTSASVYQMLRGAVVIFTGLFSFLFLHRRFRAYEWLSLFMVVAGVAIVGLSSILFPQTKPQVIGEDGAVVDDAGFDMESIVGVVFVLGAQVFTATQFVFEEKILSKYSVTPLKAVGLEGTFGFVSVLASLPLMHIFLRHQSSRFDMYQGFHEFFDNPGVWQTGIAISLSISFFNYFGLSVTNTASATVRSTIDTTRTMFIWMVSLYLGWEQFSWIQVVGFVVMVTGTFYFNGVLEWPFVVHAEPTERQPLLHSE